MGYQHLHGYQHHPGYKHLRSTRRGIGLYGTVRSVVHVHTEFLNIVNYHMATNLHLRHDTMHCVTFLTRYANVVSQGTARSSLCLLRRIPRASNGPSLQTLVTFDLALDLLDHCTILNLCGESSRKYDRTPSTLQGASPHAFTG
jgi:hypothetical protein